MKKTDTFSYYHLVSSRLVSMGFYGITSLSISLSGNRRECMSSVCELPMLACPPDRGLVSGVVNSGRLAEPLLVSLPVGTNLSLLLCLFGKTSFELVTGSAFLFLKQS